MRPACDPLFALLAKAPCDPLLLAQALVRLKDPRGIDPLLKAVSRAATELDLPSLMDSMAAPPPTVAAKPGATESVPEVSTQPATAPQGAEPADASMPEPRTESVESLEWTMARGFEALVSLGPLAFEPLVQSLGDGNARLRVFAANGLGRLGDPRAVAPLTAALKDPDERVRSAAEEALRRVQAPPGAQPESQPREASPEAALPTVIYGPDEPMAPATMETSPQDTTQPADPLKRQCQQNLRELYAGIKAYEKSHGDIPNWLSDLVPQYIANTTTKAIGSDPYY